MKQTKKKSIIILTISVVFAVLFASLILGLSLRPVTTSMPYTGEYYNSSNDLVEMKITVEKKTFNYIVKQEFRNIYEHDVDRDIDVLNEFGMESLLFEYDANAFSASSTDSLSESYFELLNIGNIVLVSVFGLFYLIAMILVIVYGVKLGDINKKELIEKK